MKRCSCNEKVFREGLKEAEVCKLPQKESLCQISGHSGLILELANTAIERTSSRLHTALESIWLQWMVVEKLHSNFKRYVSSPALS